MHRPLLLAHRGARRRAPENTLTAFDRALADGCDGFEFDVRRTADGCGIICHDATFRRMRIARHTFAALLERGQKAKQRSALGPRLPAGHNSDNPESALCCLNDVLRRYAATAFLNIELKDDGLEKIVSSGWREYRPRNCLVSSFLPDAITSVHTIAPEISLGLIADTRRGLEQWRQLPVSSVIVHRALLSAQLLDELHAAENRVFVWTVNDEREMLRFAEWGVDGIISDETELLSRTFART